MIDQKFNKYIKNNKTYFCKKQRFLQEYFDKQGVESFEGFKTFFPLNPLMIKKNKFDKLNKDLGNFSKLIRRIMKSYTLDELQKIINFSEKEKNIYNFELSKKIPDIIPLVRFDLVFQKGLPFILELNTECPAGIGNMNYICKLYEEYLKKFKSENKLKLYFLNPDKSFTKKFPRKKDIFILTVFEKRDKGYIDELRAFKKKYPKRKVEVVNVRDLEFKKNKFYFKNKKVEFVYRAFDLKDLFNLREGKRFIENYMKSNLQIMNPLISSLLGNKMLLALIKQGKFNHLFKDVTERKRVQDLIPRTFMLNNENKKEVINKKNFFILKKATSSRAEDVYLGINHKKKSWSDLIKRGMREGDLVIQEFIKIDQKDFYFLKEDKIKIKKMYFDFLPLMVKNKVAGICNRVSSNPITNLPISKGKISLTGVYK